MCPGRGTGRVGLPAGPGDRPVSDPTEAYVPGDYTGPRPEAYAFDAAYEGVPNWDIGRPQRAFVRLVEAGLVRGPVLDVGCGTGGLTMFLARQGYEALGLDISPRAVATAREKARWRRNPARFVVWDALALDGLARAGITVRTVLDCATFHVLRFDDRERYVEGLSTVLDPGGLFCVLGDARPDPRRDTASRPPSSGRASARPTGGTCWGPGRRCSSGATAGTGRTSGWSAGSPDPPSTVVREGPRGRGGTGTRTQGCGTARHGYLLVARSGGWTGEEGNRPARTNGTHPRPPQCGRRNGRPTALSSRHPVRTGTLAGSDRPRVRPPGVQAAFENASPVSWDAPPERSATQARQKR